MIILSKETETSWYSLAEVAEWMEQCGLKPVWDANKQTVSADAYEATGNKERLVYRWVSTERSKQ